MGAAYFKERAQANEERHQALHKFREDVYDEQYELLLRYRERKGLPDCELERSQIRVRLAQSADNISRCQIALADLGLCVPLNRAKFEGSIAPLIR